MKYNSQIKSIIGNMHQSNPEDILRTRHNFREIGLESGEEDRPYIDQPLDTAIRTFQRETGLREDGIMEPGGETEQTLNLALALQENQKTPPLPPRKDEAEAKKIGQKKAEKLGELGAGMMARRFGRVPFKNKVLKNIIQKISKESEGDLAKEIGKFLEDFMINAELEKARKNREEEKIKREQN